MMFDIGGLHVALEIYAMRLQRRCKGENSSALDADERQYHTMFSILYFCICGIEPQAHHVSK